MSSTITLINDQLLKSLAAKAFALGLQDGRMSEPRRNIINIGDHIGLFDAGYVAKADLPPKDSVRKFHAQRFRDIYNTGYSIALREVQICREGSGPSSEMQAAEHQRQQPEQHPSREP